MNKRISFYVIFILFLVGIALPVHAAGNPTLTIKLYTDSNIKWEKGDYISITCKNNNTGENINLKLDLTKILEAGLQKNIPAGNYQVTDLSYEGGNSKIEQAGYAITSNFVVTDQKNAYNEIRIAAGYDEVEKLALMYSEVMIKQNGALVNELARSDESEIADEELSDSKGNELAADKHPKEDEKQTNQTPQKETANLETKRDENQVLKILPLFFLAGATAIVIFVIHKKGIL